MQSVTSEMDISQNPGADIRNVPLFDVPLTGSLQDLPRATGIGIQYFDDSMFSELEEDLEQPDFCALANSTFCESSDQLHLTAQKTTHEQEKTRSTQNIPTTTSLPASGENKNNKVNESVSLLLDQLEDHLRKGETNRPLNKQEKNSSSTPHLRSTIQ
jgi:hypothetical protein